MRYKCESKHFAEMKHDENVLMCCLLNANESSECGFVHKDNTPEDYNKDTLIKSKA